MMMPLSEKSKKESQSSTENENKQSPCVGETMSKSNIDENVEKRKKKQHSDHDKMQAILKKIATFEHRGSISHADAMTLRNQVHDSLSGQWSAVEERLGQLAMTWNPYQDTSPTEATLPTGTCNTSMSFTPASTKATQAKKKQNFYELLEIDDPERTKQLDIKKQFRKLALLYHPDKLKQRTATSDMIDSIDVKEVLEKEIEPDNQATSNEVIHFARLRLAYETLSDPILRQAYDIKLKEDLSSSNDLHFVSGIQVNNQIKLEGTTDFASLEWMARVKHKMDVMDRIAEWAKVLNICAIDLRFETGEPCVGKGCGKIVTMDRDLECFGSPRRRVYVCLLHKYIHACDHTCTSHYSDTEFDKKVCSMRAYWLIQSWIHEQQQLIRQKDHQKFVSLFTQTQTLTKETTDTTTGYKTEVSVSQDKNQQVQNCPPCLIGPEPQGRYDLLNVELGDYQVPFRSYHAEECKRTECINQFQLLEEGIYVCRCHGTPHICTFEQCNRKEIRNKMYVCWISGHVYGGIHEKAGTFVRTRQVMYMDTHGEEKKMEMEVPILLPLGKMTSYLLEGSHTNENKKYLPRISGYNDSKWKRKRKRKLSIELVNEEEVEKEDHHGKRHGKMIDKNHHPVISEGMAIGMPHAPQKWMHERVKSIVSPHCVLVQDVITTKEHESAVSIQATSSNSLLLKPVGRVLLHPQSGLHAKLKKAESNMSHFIIYLKVPLVVANLPRIALELQDSLFLPLLVQQRDTCNSLKYSIEELSDGELSIWDQQLYWGDTILGEEEQDQMTPLKDLGLQEGSILELKLNEDCPLHLANWTTQRVQVQEQEYNTVQISKEAEEDVEEQQEEQEQIHQMEQTFEKERIQRKRQKLEQAGALNHIEVLQYDGHVPRLVGVFPTKQLQQQQQQQQQEEEEEEEEVCQPQKRQEKIKQETFLHQEGEENARKTKIKEEKQSLQPQQVSVMEKKSRPQVNSCDILPVKKRSKLRLNHRSKSTSISTSSPFTN
jgi:hypothetical protein